MTVNIAILTSKLTRLMHHIKEQNRTIMSLIADDCAEIDDLTVSLEKIGFAKSRNRDLGGAKKSCPNGRYQPRIRNELSGKGFSEFGGIVHNHFSMIDLPRVGVVRTNNIKKPPKISSAKYGPSRLSNKELMEIFLKNSKQIRSRNGTKSESRLDLSSPSVLNESDSLLHLRTTAGQNVVDKQRKHKSMLKYRRDMPTIREEQRKSTDTGFSTIKSTETEIQKDKAKTSPVLKLIDRIKSVKTLDEEGSADDTHKFSRYLQKNPVSMASVPEIFKMKTPPYNNRSKRVMILSQNTPSLRISPPSKRPSFPKSIKSGARKFDNNIRSDSLLFTNAFGWTATNELDNQTKLISPICTPIASQKLIKINYT